MIPEGQHFQYLSSRGLFGPSGDIRLQIACQYAKYVADETLPGANGKHTVRVWAENRIQKNGERTVPGGGLWAKRNFGKDVPDRPGHRGEHPYPTA